MAENDHKPATEADKEVLSINDTTEDATDSELKDEYSRAVMKRLVHLGYMDAGLDI